MNGTYLFHIYDACGMLRKNAKPKKEGSYLSGKIFDTKEEGVNDLRTVRQVFFTNLIFNAVIDSRVLYDMCMIYQYTLNNFFRTL